MNSETLFSILSQSHSTGSAPAEILTLTDDSRQVSEGSCFVAVKGSRINGHDLIDSAIDAGACAIVAESAPSPLAQEKGIYWVQVPDSRQANGELVSQWHGEPSKQLVMLGVTGTNGKTTTSYLCNHIMRASWRRAGLIGTIITDDGHKRQTAQNTTPGSHQLQQLLATMVENGCRAVAMEVSSHALSQKRCAGTQFSVGIFTNLTQDHLDYHGDMEEYYEAKKQLFYDMIAHGARKATAVINIDDSYGRRLYEELAPLMRVRSFGLADDADYRATPSIVSLKGSQFELHYQGRQYLVRTPLIGDFNISNSLAAIAGCSAAGITLRDAIAAVAHSPQVPGRLELVSSVNNVQSFVDYAHTPDAVDNVCSTMRSLCRAGRLITVFGCGGDRDKTKRPLMGEAAARYSDICIVTSDNPRSEDPESIIDDVMQGIPKPKQQRITDRREAIHAALELTRPGDALLVCGKGHEDYQIFAEETVHFSDIGAIHAYYREQNPEGISTPSRPPRDRGAGFDRDARPERGGRFERGGHFERGERPERGGRFERGERPERGGRFERGERPERGGHFERGERPERGGHFERGERSDRGGRFDRGERPERGERFERGERPDRGGHFERGERPERGERFDRDERPERGHRPTDDDDQDQTPRKPFTF